MADKAGARIGAGDVSIRILDENDNLEELVMRPSYHAARTLSAQAGGILKVMQRVAVDFDVEAAVLVITLGLGYGVTNRRPPKDLAERIWRTGLSDDTGGLAERCVTYLRTLMRGGQAPTDSGEGGSDEEVGDDSSAGPR